MGSLYCVKEPLKYMMGFKSWSTLKEGKQFSKSLSILIGGKKPSLRDCYYFLSNSENTYVTPIPLIMFRKVNKSKG